MQYREASEPLASLVLRRLGVTPEPAAPQSELRFPDGAQFRIEIPSVEGPEALSAVVEPAEDAGIVVNRVSQGSGAILLKGNEVSDMAALGADKGLEVSLFVGPRDECDLGASARAADGAGLYGVVTAAI